MTVTAMLHDRKYASARLAIFRACGASASSLIARLTGVSVVDGVSLLSRPLRGFNPHEFACGQTGGRWSPAIKKFSAEAFQAPSADLVCEIDLNVASDDTVHTMTNQKTEQHRCTAV